MFGKYLDFKKEKHEEEIKEIQDGEPYIGPGIYEEMTPEFEKPCWSNGKEIHIVNNLKRKANEDPEEEESSESDPPSHLDGVFRELCEAWIEQHATLILQSMLDQELKKQRSKSSARSTLKVASDSITKK